MPRLTAAFFFISLHKIRSMVSQEEIKALNKRLEALRRFL
jgi:hypothetical protein